MSFLKKILLNDKYILYFVLLSSATIFIQLFPDTPDWLDFLDVFFTLLFVTEAIVKINHYGFGRYWKSRWNRFDFILTTIAIPSLFIINSGIPLNAVLVLRSFRIIKSLRLIKFIPNVKSIIVGVNNAIKSSYVIIITFITVLFVISVVNCTLFNEFAPEYFDTPVNALYSTFRLFTVEGWYEIPDAIGENSTPLISFLSKFYFVALLFSFGIIGMSIINSIFVDAMVSDNNDDLNLKIDELNAKIDELVKEIKNNKGSENTLNG